MITHAARGFKDDLRSEIEDDPGAREEFDLLAGLRGCEFGLLAARGRVKKLCQALCAQTSAAGLLQMGKDVNCLLLFFEFSTIMGVDQHIRINEYGGHSGLGVPGINHPASSRVFG